jgi:hypothetical protein
MRGVRKQIEPCSRSARFTDICTRHMCAEYGIEVLNLKRAVKMAILLLLYQTDIKVSKDALACEGPYQTLMSVWYIGPGGENTVRLPATIQI